MTILNPNDSLLMIIDVQEKLINAAFNKNLIEKKATIIAKAASMLNIPIIATEQYPKGLGSTISCIKLPINNIKYMEKISFSALDNIEIKNELLRYQKKQIIILGIETHICVSQTANALAESGYSVSLIKDASGSRSEAEHIAGIDRMKGNNVNILTTEIALFEWLRTSKNVKFKEIQALIK